MHRGGVPLELIPIHRIGPGDAVCPHWLEHDPGTDPLDVLHPLASAESLRVTSLSALNRNWSFKYARFHDVLQVAVEARIGVMQVK
jgi:hypothetical protein